MTDVLFDNALILAAISVCLTPVIRWLWCKYFKDMPGKCRNIVGGIFVVILWPLHLITTFAVIGAVLRWLAT